LRDLEHLITMHQMIINGTTVSISPGMTVSAAARSVGIPIPALCHRDGLHPSGGCGVCTVEDVATGRLLPACASRADDAMRIETHSERARAHRKAALELLLGNHPADCEAPCQMACPSGLPIPELLRLVADARWEAAEALAQHYPVNCGHAPCEKVCRRKPLDGAVAICAIHRLLAGPAEMSPTPPPGHAPRRHRTTDAPRFRSRMTGLPEAVLLSLAREKGARAELSANETFTRQHAMYEGARCLQCGCRKADDCRLRDLCAEAGARQATFAGERSAVVRGGDGRGFAFDASRCVLCGLCVRTAEAMGASVAPTFRGRGFNAHIAPPLGRVWRDIEPEVLAACAASCPTGAMVSP